MKSTMISAFAVVCGVAVVLQGTTAAPTSAPTSAPATTAAPTPPPTPIVDPLPLPACADDGVITLLAARYSGSGLDRHHFGWNCTIRGQPGSVIVGPLPQSGTGSLRIEGTLQFDAAGRELLLGGLTVRGSVVFKNCSAGDDARFADWIFERSMVIFQDCDVTSEHGQVDIISNSTVILIDSIYTPDSLQIESSQLNMTRADLYSTSNIRINDATMSLISSSISAGGRNRYISIANSVMSLHNSSVGVGGEDNYVTPLSFVNTTATFTGSGSININAYVSSTSTAVSFVDSWVSFPHCSSLDQVINVAGGNISIKGGRVWCVSNTAMTAEDNAQIATVVV